MGICNLGGVKTGTAQEADVRGGKTFMNSTGVHTGTATNHGNVTLRPSGNESVRSGSGFYDSVTADGSQSYNKGVNDADARVNTSSVSYNSGYANAGFQLAVNTVLRSYGGTQPYPGNGNQNYTLTATETTWWVAGAVTVGSSARCTGQGSGILQAGQSRTFTAYTNPTDAPHEQAVVFITAWIKR